MKRWIFGLGILCILATPIVGVAEPIFESHVYFDNTSDASVWVTAYSQSECEKTMSGRPSCNRGGSEGAWCVAPGKYDQHGLRAHIYEVRAEVSQAGCQRHPVALNQLRGFPYSYYKSTMTYYVHGKNGQYVYGNH
jgi:hypothetical protein